MKIIGFITVFLISISGCVIASGQNRKKSSTKSKAAIQSTQKAKTAVITTRNILENKAPTSTNATLKNLSSVKLYQTFGSDDAKIWAQQWAFSRQVFAAYYQDNQNNLIVAPFADVMNQLFKLSYPKRAEIGRNKEVNFAGDFVRETFLYAALDIAKNWNHWRNPLTQDELTVIQQKNYDCGMLAVGVGLIATIETNGNSAFGATVALTGMDACIFQITPSTSLGFVGQHHFDEHLAPAFYQHFRRVFSRLAKENINSDQNELARKIQQKIESIRKEHNEQLVLNKLSYDKAEKLPGWDLFSAFLAKEIIPPRASALRESMFQTAIVDMRETGELDQGVASSILDYLSTTNSIGKGAFIVGQFLNTRLRIQKGDIIQIESSGEIRLGVIASSSPKGMAGNDYKNYSIIQKYPHGALLGRILGNGTNTSEWELIGQGKRIVAQTNGILEFLVNDGDPSNNIGNYSVRVTINSKQNSDAKKKSGNSKDDNSSSSTADKDSKEEKPKKESKTKKTLKKIWDNIKKPE